MSATARARARRGHDLVRPKHYHLPSVHVRHGGTGYDYDEDLYVIAPGQVNRVVRFVAIDHGAETLIRETRDELSAEEWAQFRATLPVLMKEGNPEVEELMQERAALEFQRQLRIAAGSEHVCRGCGCSETRSCSGGCIWISANFCSRCA